MRIIVNEVDYHVEIMGEGEPLLLLHGFTGDISTWDSLSHYFASSYKVILIDIVGHGLTQKPSNAARYDIELVASDLREILKKLSVERINILGYSMGGRLALTFAIKYPERTNTLILESASPGLIKGEDRFERRRLDEKLANKIVDEGIKPFVEYWTNIPLFQTQKLLPSSIQASIRKQRLSNNSSGLANSLLGMGTGSQPSWWNQLNHLQLPVLLITGELDKKFCHIAGEMKKSLMNAEHITILGAGHAIHVERPKKFGTIVVEFLTKYVLQK